MSALHGLAADMQLPLDHFARLVGDPMTEASDEEDCVLLSAMQYGAAEGCEEHVDRGLLTLVAGQTAATLRADRRQRKWVRPPATDESVVIFAGGTLHRASAGLVPAATGDADDGIGATLHRVAAGGDARFFRPPPPRTAGRVLRLRRARRARRRRRALRRRPRERRRVPQVAELPLGQRGGGGGRRSRPRARRRDRRRS